MPSKPRNYVKDVPVGVTVRVVFGKRLFRGLGEYAKTLLAYNSRRCKVRIIGYFILDNHLHLILAQDFDGHHRLIGIAAFMRNFTSALIRKANRVHKVRGRVEKTYHSYSIHSTERLLQALAYLHGQLCRHGIPIAVEDYDGCSWPVYTAGEPDGIVDCRPAFYSELADAPMPRARRMGKLLTDIVELAVTNDDPDAWAVATQRVMARCRLGEVWVSGLTPVDTAAHHMRRAARIGARAP